MNHLNVTKDTTNGQIKRFCEDNPQWDAKVIRAQAQHERRVKRIAWKNRKRDIGTSNAEQNEYWIRVGGHPSPEQQDQ